MTALLTLALVLSACASPAAPADTALKVSEAVVVTTYPHDREVFTQGLELHDGVLYQTSGGFAASWIGTSTLDNPVPVLRVASPEAHFAEGLTIVGTKVWQLTWQNGVAVERDRATLAPLREVGYQGEGWGLCLMRDRLVMSNGTPELTFRDPATFAETGRVTVTRDGQPVERLNELECIDGSVWANVWRTEDIVRIDPGSGRVTHVVHIGEMPGTTAADRVEGSLNGIAALPGTDDLLITGKNWPHMYRIAWH